MVRLFRGRPDGLHLARRLQGPWELPLCLPSWLWGAGSAKRSWREGGPSCLPCLPSRMPTVLRSEKGLGTIHGAWPWCPALAQGHLTPPPTPAPGLPPGRGPAQVPRATPWWTLQVGQTGGGLGRHGVSSISVLIISVKGRAALGKTWGVGVMTSGCRNGHGAPPKVTRRTRGRLHAIPTKSAGAESHSHPRSPV